MPFLPVNTACVVSLGSIVDDSDFKTLETAIAYNQAGMNADLIKVTLTTISKTDITPTDGGANAWLTAGNAVYGLKLTAAQNNTLGELRVVGICNGVLVFESPVYQVIPQQTYNSLFAGTDKLQVDAAEVSGDSAAADKLELFAEALGSDNKVLVSTDAQDLSATLDVNAKTLGDGAITAAKIAASAITSAKLATDAIGADAFSQAAADKVWSTTTRTITGLTAAAIKSIWDQLTSALTAAGSIGKLLVDNINATVSSRSSHTAAAAGTDAASKVLATPANLLETDADGRVDVGSIEGADATDQISAEVIASLTAARLDELMVTALNGQPVAGSLMADLTEDDGGTQRFSANALEQGPSGSDQNVLVSTTVATVTDQTHFVLTAGPEDDDALLEQAVVFYDAGSSNSPSVRKVTDYDAGTTTITIDAAPDFTVVNGDGVKVFVTAPGTTAPTAAQVADAVLDEALADHDQAGSAGAAISDAHAAAANKLTVNRDTGDMKVYDDDGETVRITRQITELSNDVQGVIPQ